MAKKNKKTKSKNYKANQAYRDAQSKKANEKSTMSIVVRWVLIGLLIIALCGSLFFGIVASAYSLPAQTDRGGTGGTGLGVPVSFAGQTGTPSPVPPVPGSSLDALQHFELQPGDIIDGKPAEEYLPITDDLPDVQSPIAALCTRDGRILFERNIDEKVTMASTTKMMTAIIAIETTPLDTPLKVTYGASNAAGTDAGLAAGMNISLLDCLYALLLPSGNDAAMVIAENISGMEIRFVELMNKKAVELGMSSTHYLDSSGLSEETEGAFEENHVTTARDYLVLAQYCMRNPTFREIVATGTYQANIDGVVLDFITTDALSFYLKDAKAIGIKTGFTDGAGYCFVGAGQANGLELYSVVFDAPTEERRFVDTARMLEWGFRHYRTVELINTTQQVAEVALLSWIDKTVAAYVPSVVRIELFDLNGPITQDIKINDIAGDANKGASCGEIIWTQGGEVQMISEVIVDRTVLAPDFWEGLSIAWQRFWGTFENKPPHAETTILLKSELAIPDSPPT